MHRFKLWRATAAWSCLLVVVMNAPTYAKCLGEHYSMRLGQTVHIEKTSDGGNCTDRVIRSLDPIYGSNIISRPQHGTLTSAGRTVLIYTPQAGFRGTDTYSFQWVGKQGGITPGAVTVNVSVKVR